MKMGGSMSNLEFLSILLLFIVVTTNQPAASTNLQPIQALNAIWRIPGQPVVVPRTKDRFSLLDLFDFSRFKTLFEKSYASILEEVVRRKLYLGRAFRVFISAVSYRYHVSSSYLAINHMSDWTPTESVNGYIEVSTKGIQKGASPQLEDLPMVSLTDIKHKFSYIMQHRDMPGYREIYRELKDGFKRKLIQFASSTREISLDHLIRASKDEVNNSLMVNYQSGSSNKGLKDFGARESLTNDGLNEMRLLDQVNNTEYLDEIIQASVSNFINSTRSTHKGYRSRRHNNNKPPDEIFIDHRLSNCFSKPRNQGSCGGCYSFTAIALYEYAYCRTTGRYVAFSEQYIIDCGEVAGLHGCRCGWFSRIPNFVGAFGLEFRSNYPYISREGICPIPPGTPSGIAGSVKVKRSGFVSFSLDMVDSVLQHVPMAMNVFITKSFREYGGGVDDAIGCRDKNYLHAMALIGSGREDGKEYWLLRNSFSTRWGVEGHYKLNKQSDCIRNNIASALDVTFDFAREKKRQNVMQHYEQ